jgi:MFS transporter, MHS family, citrate/tricarballylate:H+ symporter
MDCKGDRAYDEHRSQEGLMTPELSRTERKAMIGKIVRVSSGNFLEMYDFVVYGYYATYIAGVFFPSGNQFASLMLSLMTFGVGYLMRPLGALILGAYIDRKGRRKGLILTVLLMAIGTLSIAVTPGYALLGILAPLIIVVGRLMQGFSAGVELGGVSVYLSEIATPGNRGFYVSWQSASQQIAVVFTALVGIVLTAQLSPLQITAWGWRVPFLVGCLIIPVLLWLLRSLDETDAFLKGPPPRSARATFAMVLESWKPVVIGMMLSALTTTTFYLITAYTPTFGQQALHLGINGTLVVTLCVGLSNFIWVPIGGALSDRIGGRPLLIAMPVLCLLTAYPTMAWLVHAPSLSRLLVVELWYSLIFGLYNGAMIPFLLGMMPQRIRTAAFSLAFSLNTVVFGGFTPAIAMFLIRATGSRAAPALWLSFAAGLSLIAALVAKRSVESGNAVAVQAIH